MLKELIMTNHTNDETVTFHVGQNIQI
jgi:hypothetical protein